MKIRIAVSAVVLALLIAGILYWYLNRPTGEIILHGINARPAASVPGTLFVFASFTNNGGPDWLNSVGSSGAVRAELFSPAGAARVPIPAGATPSLAEDGAHMRLFGLEGDLAAGRLVPISLNFENAGRVTANARVGSDLSIDGSTEAGQYGIGRILQIPEGAAVPQVEVDAEKTSAGWRIRVKTENFEFSDPAEGMSEAEFGTGHGHLYLSGLKIVRVYGNEVEIGELPPGKHEIRVILVTDDHRAFGTGGALVSAATTIEVSS